jgi:hypothetical protein
MIFNHSGPNIQILDFQWLTTDSEIESLQTRLLDPFGSSAIIKFAHFWDIEFLYDRRLECQITTQMI